MIEEQLKSELMCTLSILHYSLLIKSFRKRFISIGAMKPNILSCIYCMLSE